MEFLTEFLIISIIGGIVAIDTTAGWQILISQPLVACTLLGVLFDNYHLGLWIGILLEIPWLLEIPYGGAHTSEGNIGAITATGISIHLVQPEINKENIIIILAILWGLGVSWIGGKLVKSMRRMNVMFAYRADRAAEQANYKKISLLNIGGIGHAFSLGFLFVGASFLIGTPIISKLAAMIPEFFDSAFSYGKIGLLALSVSIMLKIAILKENYRYSIFGALIALCYHFIQ